MSNQMNTRWDPLHNTYKGTPIPHEQAAGLSYVAVSCSPSHTYGNALAFIQNWIVELFDKDFFKTFHIYSKIAHRQLKSSGKDYFKKERPILVVKPRIDTNEDRFLSNTPFIERFTDLYSTYGYTAYQPFFYDDKNQIAIEYQMNRLVMYTDVTIILDTVMQQIDVESYIRNSTRINHPFFIDTYFETYLPMEMLNILSNIAGIPIIDSDGNTKDFLQYMNTYSGYPITFKLNGATGDKEFYRYYPVRIDTNISDISMSDGEKTGQISSNYTINFTIKMEFNSVGMFYMFNKNIRGIQKKILPMDNKRDNLVPVFTDIDYYEDHDTRPGWAFYRKFSIRLEKPNESVDISSTLNKSLMFVIDYHLQNRMPMMDLIDIKIRKQGKTIFYGQDYTIDYAKRTINFLTDDYGYYTYSVIITVNIDYVNTMVKTLLKLQ